jgi:hypothetical protein
VTITEGKKHILRKAFQYSGHPVEKLRRVSIGSIALGKLPPGEWRELREEEVEAFKRQYRYGEQATGKKKGGTREERGAGPQTPSVRRGSMRHAPRTQSKTKAPPRKIK